MHSIGALGLIQSKGQFTPKRARAIHVHSRFSAF